jgi:hypothetical protein
LYRGKRKKKLKEIVNKTLRGLRQLRHLAPRSPGRQGRSRHPRSRRRRSFHHLPPGPAIRRRASRQSDGPFFYAGWFALLDFGNPLLAERRLVWHLLLHPPPNPAWLHGSPLNPPSISVSSGRGSRGPPSGGKAVRSGDRLAWPVSPPSSQPQIPASQPHAVLYGGWLDSARCRVFGGTPTRGG